MITLSDIVQAKRRLSGHVLVSPSARSESLDLRTHAHCWLKLENLQRTGSFKERGACNRLSAMDATERARGVVCASAGNHAQGVAYHANRLGIDATIVMPEKTPLIKVQNTRNFGGRVVLYGAGYDDSYEEACRIEREEGRVFVHPFNDDLVMAGQGTIGLEILDQNPDVEAVVLAIGGGGLAGGVALAIKESSPHVKIYGVQMTQFAGMKRALAEGHPVTLDPARTVAEGIAVRRVGDRTFDVVKKYVDDIVLVDDEEVAAAILFLLEREKTVAEGAGAAPIAALLHDKLPIAGKNVVAVLCGGNIDVNVISRIIERGLVKSGRMIRLLVAVPDVFGSLAQLTSKIAQCKANIVQIHHERAFAKSGVSDVLVELVLETRGPDHGVEVEKALQDAGYTILQP